MPSPVERAWVAGIIDADGCVTLRAKDRAFRDPHVVVDSTDVEILDELSRLYGGALVKKKVYSELHRQAFSWRLYGPTRVLAFLADILPFMRCPSKVERAQMLLQEYAVVTRRNGWYDEAARGEKEDFEERFMAVGHGRGSSVRLGRVRLVGGKPPRKR